MCERNGDLVFIGKEEQNEELLKTIVVNMFLFLVKELLTRAIIILCFQLFQAIK
jgi:hypothetical protein